MAALTALYDASVLYPAPLRDLLMHLALTDLFRAKWTEAIHDEWTRNVLQDRPDLRGEKIQRTRALMNAHVRDCLITDYEEFIPAVSLPDPDDRHVLAAAIRGRVDVIVTMNLKHFPAEALAKYGMEAQHPDEFVLHIMGLSQAPVIRAIKNQRHSLRNPPVSVEDFLMTLENQSLVRSVAALRLFADLI